MPRSFTYSALTLRVIASGESNREAWFLTAEEGLMRATVFGGPKSRLRGRVAPFHEGKLWIYHDPVRDSRKVSDFDVRSYRTGIRELYERLMAAAAVAETILVSHGGGGEWEEAAKLSGAVLDAIGSADAATCPYMALYFLWHWAGLLGARPDLSSSRIKLGPGGRSWLNGIESLPPEGLAGIPFDPASLEEVKAFIKAALASALGKWLPTWEGI